MSQLEFLLALLSIIVGLGLADLAQGLRNLVRPHQPVRWHWLPLAWVLITFLIVANFWWSYFGDLQMEVWRNYFAFLLLLGEVMSLYLLCAFALPDLEWRTPQRIQSATLQNEPPPATDTELDLERFYFSNSHRRWFFGCFLILLAFVEATESAEQWYGYGVVAWDVGETLRTGLASSALVLLVTDRETVHTTVTLGVLFGLIYFISQYASGLK